MADIPQTRSAETEEEYIHVQYRDPDDFEEIRTSDWAETVAKSVSEGSEVRTGKRENGNWGVQSVLIKKTVGEEKARK